MRSKYLSTLMKLTDKYAGDMSKYLDVLVLSEMLHYVDMYKKFL